MTDTQTRHGRRAARRVVQPLLSGAALLLLACAEAAEDENVAGAAGQAGSGGATETPGLEVLHEGEDGPYALALDDRYLYWVSGAGLRRAPIDGGEPTTLATLDSVASLVPAGDYLNFQLSHSYARAEVGRVSRESGEVQWFANESNPSGLAVNAEALFWGVTTNSAPGQLKRSASDAGEHSTLATNLGFPRHLALDGDQLYFGDGNTRCGKGSPTPCIEPGIFRVSTAGGVPARVVSTEAGSNPIWNEGSMYWLAGSPRPSVVMVLPPGGAAQPVANLTIDSPRGPTELVADTEALYWNNGTRVLRMPFATGTVERLVSGLDVTRGVAVRGDWVYLAEVSKGRILRIATDGSAYRPTAQSVTGPCPTPIGSAEELALTPRADTNMELLGFVLEPDNVVVTQPTYERLVDDVAAIRTFEATLADVYHREIHDGRRFQLTWTAATAEAFADGLYTAWDCLNEVYGLRSVTPLDSGVELELDGIYNLPLVFERYRQLPGVTGGASMLGGAPAPDICVAREGERYEYVFDAAGECPEGCPERRAYYFVSESSGQVTQLAAWDATTGAPVPDWFEELCGFRPRVED
jgi:hypothetical protein